MQKTKTLAPSTLTPLEEQLRASLLKPLDKLVCHCNAGGERYEGQVHPETGKRHGRGMLKWPNRNCYIGDWEDGAMSGRGTFLYAAEGDRYDGGFFDDKKHGTGEYIFQNGNRYNGAFKADKRHGEGKYTWVCGDSYEGEWLEGRMHGQGTTIYANGNRYDGSFVEDRREGKGKLVCTDGLTYEGEWLKNNRHGNGRLDFVSGDSYVGEWIADKKHGHGRDTHANGNIFEGKYEQNAKCGEGTMRYCNGDRYDGEWKADKMHGLGRYTFVNGFMYHGYWDADTRHGFGVYRFPTGHVYRGEWQNDRRHGRGTLILNAARKSNNASSTSNDAYVGHWQEGKMHGDFSVYVPHSEDLPDTTEEELFQVSARGIAVSALLEKATDIAKVRRFKYYEGTWALGVPSSRGSYFHVMEMRGEPIALALRGAWKGEGATKNSDGTIEKIDWRLLDLAKCALLPPVVDVTEGTKARAERLLAEPRQETQLSAPLMVDPFARDDGVFSAQDSCTALLGLISAQPASRAGEVVATVADDIPRSIGSALALDARALMHRIVTVETEVLARRCVPCLLTAEEKMRIVADSYATSRKQLQSAFFQNTPADSLSLLQKQLVNVRKNVHAEKHRVVTLEHDVDSGNALTKECVRKVKLLEEQLAQARKDRDVLLRQQKEVQALACNLQQLQTRASDASTNRDKILRDVAQVEENMQQLEIERIQPLLEKRQRYQSTLRDLSGQIRTADGSLMEAQRGASTQISDETKDAQRRVSELELQVGDLEGRIATWESAEAILEEELQRAADTNARETQEREAFLKTVSLSLQEQRSSLEAVLGDLAVQRSQATNLEDECEKDDITLQQILVQVRQCELQCQLNDQQIGAQNDIIKGLQEEERRAADVRNAADKQMRHREHLRALKHQFNKELLEHENHFLQISRDSDLQLKRKENVQRTLEVVRGANSSLKMEIEEKRLNLTTGLQCATAEGPQDSSAVSRLRRISQSQRSSTPTSEGGGSTPPTPGEPSPEDVRHKHPSNSKKAKPLGFRETKKRHVRAESEIIRLQQEHTSLLESVAALKRKVSKKHSKKMELQAQLERTPTPPPKQTLTCDDEDPFPLAPSSSFLNASKEAALHQLMKQRGIFTRLFKEKQTLESQLLGQVEEDDADDCDVKRSHEKYVKGLLETIAQEQRAQQHDWRINYLVEQLETRRKAVVELEQEARVIPVLEERVAALTSTIQEARMKSISSSGRGDSTVF